MDSNESMKLVVRVNRDSHPELFDELSQRSANRRGERLRSLATAALLGRNASSTSHASNASVTPEIEREPEVDSSGELVRKKNDFKKSISF